MAILLKGRDTSTFIIYHVKKMTHKYIFTLFLEFFDVHFGVDMTA